MTKAIRLVLVIDDLGYGGAERQVVELANNMNPERFDVHVCALAGHVPLAGNLRDAPRRLHVIERKGPFDYRVITHLVALLRDLRADIVHGYLFSAEIASRIAGKLAGTRVVIGSERNANHVLSVRNWIGYKLTQGLVHATVANSHAGAIWNGTVFRRPLSDYHVVHNGVDTARFRPADGAEIRRRLGIPGSAPLVGAFANFKKQKNHAMTFRAFKQVLNGFPGAQLLLVGDPPVDSRRKLTDYCDYLHQLVDHLGIRDHCIFMGHQDATEHLYPACDATVLSSRHEGTPNVLLESMACGVPVVATRVCDNEYVVRDGEVGCLVDMEDHAAMADCIGLLLSDSARRQEMGRKARQWMCEEFSTRRLAEKMEAVYLELLSHKGRRVSQHGRPMWT